jgi:hypothetical protein
MPMAAADKVSEQSLGATSAPHDDDCSVATREEFQDPWPPAATKGPEPADELGS